MKTSITLVLLAAFGFAVRADTPDEEAARRSAESHNEAIRRADEAFINAVAKAKVQHRAKVIETKERLIVELRRTLRSAVRGRSPENGLVIGRQIDALKQEVEALKSEAALAKAAQRKRAMEGRFVTSGTGVSVIRARGDKEFVDGKLRERWQKSRGDWIDLTLLDDTLQESVIGGRGHVQYQNGRIREVSDSKHGQWIDLTVYSDKRQFSVVPGVGGIEYQNGRLREVWSAEQVAQMNLQTKSCSIRRATGSRS